MSKKALAINPLTERPRPPLLVRWAERLRRLGRARVYTWAAFLIVSITLADHLTDYRFRLSRFHMIPVAFVAWTLGRAAGGWTGVLCLAVWAVGEGLAPTGSMAMHFWDALVRTLYFIGAVLILSALREALDQEKSLARTDFLTGVANRRFFTELAMREIRRARRYNTPFIVAYLDIDGFKKVNDRFGHDQGDALLRLVAVTIRGALREADTVARLGGDEFAVLLPDTDGVHARDIMTKLQVRLAEVMAEHAWPVTFSIGTVSYPTPPASVDEMIKTADQLMYSVKARGKNSIGFAESGAAARRRD